MAFTVKSVNYCYAPLENKEISEREVKLVREKIPCEQEMCGTDWGLCSKCMKVYNKVYGQ